MRGRLYHCNSEIIAQLNDLIKLIYTTLSLSFERPRSLKALWTCFFFLCKVRYYVQFELNERLLCEIIERYECKRIIVVIVGLYTVCINEWHRFDCHGLCKTSLKHLIMLLNPITYIGHFLHLYSDCWHRKWCVFFRGYQLISWLPFWQYLFAYFNHIWYIFHAFAPIWSMQFI